MRRGIIVTALLIIGTVALAVAKPVNKDFSVGKNLEIFFNVFKNINLVYVDDVQPDKLMRKATDAMLKTLDPYTTYLSEEDMEEFKMSTTGKYGGVGSLISKPDSAAYASVAGPYKGFPIDRAGIVIGDSIVAIDGKDLRRATASEVSNSMKGDPGSTFTITVKKLRTGAIEDHILRRETIKIPPITYYGILPGEVGYISFSTFSKDGANDVKNALVELKKSGIKGLILDLRNNGGGIIDEAVDIVGLFTPVGTEVVHLKGRDTTENKSYKTNKQPIDTQLPLAVLINNGSASASEIVAGALQDLDRAVVIGRRSFGKGLVQATFNVGYGSYLKVTTAKYYIPSGRCIQALDYTHRNEDGSVGVVPDTLISEFTTRNGRKVYDGGGITPDILITDDKFNLFVLSVYARRYIEDFATLYYKDHTDIPSVDNFRLNDADYARFVAYLKDKPIEFKSYSEEHLAKLKESAKKEKSYDKIKEELDKIEAILTERDKTRSLEENKETLKELIEEEIVTRYHYEGGGVRHAALKDKQVDEAKRILLDKARYDKILKEQNTVRSTEKIEVDEEDDTE